MSAITIIDRALGPDGVRRYKTRWKILVKSHQHNNTIDLSKALITVNTTKTTKSVGNLSVSLVADRNYLNYVFPNDYISAYCDKGDGQGWTRVHFGFVDNITEIDRVDAAGKPTTLYTLVCSDFQKAFERTQIYFNPHVAARSDFDGDFIGTTNMGGAALRTRGLLAHGSPADVVVNVILLLMGFGGQFILPASFVPRNLSQVRAQRAEFALGLLSEDIRRQVLDLGGYQAFLDQIKTQAGFDDTVSTDQLLRTDPESPLAGDVQRHDRQRFSLAAQRALDGRGPNDTGGNGLPLNGGEAFLILNTTVSSAPPTLLDIIDLSTFVERNAIDGYFAELSIWERQDSVWSFINSISNEIVNELFLDLRPLSRDGGLTVGTDFSRELDELGGNEADVGVNGICHVPALIMREYPFSTIDRIDAQNVPITVVQSSTSATSFTGNTIGNLGTVIFGAIFSDRPNEPGRHVVTIPSISVQSRANGTSPDTAQKHLDVAVVHNSEIITSTLSRSDTDHFNLIEMVSENAMSGEASRFYMRDLSPLITPVAIVRHGLRKRTLSTRCARGGLDLANRVTNVSGAEELEDYFRAEAPESVVVRGLPPTGRGGYGREELESYLSTFVAINGIRNDAPEKAEEARARGLEVWLYAGPDHWLPRDQVTDPREHDWATTLQRQIDLCLSIGAVGIIADPERNWEGKRAEAQELGRALKQASSRVRVGFTSFPTWPWVESLAAECVGYVWGSPQIYGRLQQGADTFARWYRPWADAFGAARVIPSIAGWVASELHSTPEGYAQYLATLPVSTGCIVWDESGTPPSFIVSALSEYEPVLRNATEVTSLPVSLLNEGSRFTQGWVDPQSQWWYRLVSAANGRHVNNLENNPQIAEGVNYWRFHNGVDIVGPLRTPVRAIRAGFVCMALPEDSHEGEAPGYGNCVYIYHPQDNMYSLYAHLDSFAEAVAPVSRARTLRAHQSRRLNQRGQFTEVAVVAGDVIGYLGGSATSAPHLHFEINVLRNGRSFSSQYDRSTRTPDRFKQTTDIPAGTPEVSGTPSPTRPSNPSQTSTISQDPIQVFADRFALTLPLGSSRTGGGTEVDEELVTPSDDGGEDANLPATPPVPVEEEEVTQTTQTYTHVDTAITRRQLARWTLLHDHWYQHNIEYVSGNIEMRGAPEIRAGYRLDLPDRNMSFYVESVSHTWNVDQHMTTNLQVTRGQPTNPHPVYVLPPLEGFEATETQRRVNSRLGAFFMCPDPVAVRRALTVRKGTQVVPAQARVSAAYNETDFGERRDNYNETLIDAVTGTSDPNFAAELREAEARSLGITSANNSSSGFSTNPASNSTYSDALARVRRDGI